MLWAGGSLFDARHRNSDLARQSARRKGEAKVGKGGKGGFCEGELVLDMCLPLYSTLQCFCFGVAFVVVAFDLLFSVFGVCPLFVFCLVFVSCLVFPCFGVVVL